jgi:hypothetical protein
MRVTDTPDSNGPPRLPPHRVDIASRDTGHRASMTWRSSRRFWQGPDAVRGKGQVESPRTSLLTRTNVLALLLAVGGTALSWRFRAILFDMSFNKVLLILVAAIAISQLLINAVRAIRASRVEAEVFQQIDKIERVAPLPRAEATLVSQSVELLFAAAERERIAIGRSERRLGWLYQIGTALVIVAGIVPFMLVGLYMRDVPIARIEALQKAGVDAKVLAEVTQHDWHLLLAGVSFGLLFLAAARGIFQSEARQREAYQAAARWASYYGDLERGLRIANLLASEESEYGEKVRGDAVRRVIDRMLSSEGPKPVTAAKENGDGVTPEHWKALLELASKGKE